MLSSVHLTQFYRSVKDKELTAHIAVSIKLLPRQLPAQSYKARCSSQIWCFISNAIFILSQKLINIPFNYTDHDNECPWSWTHKISCLTSHTYTLKSSLYCVSNQHSKTGFCFWAKEYVLILTSEQRNRTEDVMGTWAVTFDCTFVMSQPWVQSLCVLDNASSCCVVALVLPSDRLEPH